MISITIPVAIFVLALVCCVLGCILIGSFCGMFIYAIVRAIRGKIEMDKYRDDLMKSGFFQELHKPMNEEEKKDLEETGEGGNTVEFNTNTRKTTVKKRKKNNK